MESYINNNMNDITYPECSNSFEALLRDPAVIPNKLLLSG
jgi:hypothetical protein